MKKATMESEEEKLWREAQFEWDVVLGSLRDLIRKEDIKDEPSK